MMLENLFSEVLHLSFYGSIGCGVVLVCVLIDYIRAPRWISMVLWGLVALRLVIPLSVSSNVSLLCLGNAADIQTGLKMHSARAAHTVETIRPPLKEASNTSRLSPSEALSLPMRTAVEQHTFTSVQTAA